MFDVSAVRGITLREQSRVSPPVFVTTAVQFSRVAADQPDAVKQIAFGRYVAPDYMVHPGEYIPAVGTSTGVPQIQGQNTIYFTLLIPNTSKPANGWPVAIVGHGGNGNKDASVFFYAAELAKHGIATIAINAVGRGRGPLGSAVRRVEVGSNSHFFVWRTRHRSKRRWHNHDERRFCRFAAAATVVGDRWQSTECR